MLDRLHVHRYARIDDQIDEQKHSARLHINAPCHDESKRVGTWLSATQQLGERLMHTATSSTISIPHRSSRNHSPHGTFAQESLAAASQDVHSKPMLLGSAKRRRQLSPYNRNSRYNPSSWTKKTDIVICCSKGNAAEEAQCPPFPDVEI